MFRQCSTLKWEKKLTRSTVAMVFFGGYLRKTVYLLSGESMRCD